MPTLKLGGAMWLSSAKLLGIFFPTSIVKKLIFYYLTTKLKNEKKEKDLQEDTCYCAFSCPCYLVN
jgi:hypothetical protein